MSKKFVEELTPRYSVVMETIFNGNSLVEYFFIEDIQTNSLVLKISPNYPTTKKNKTIIGTTYNEQFYYLDLNSGELTVNDQIVSGYETINERFVEVSGSACCILFDTFESKIVDSTVDGYIQYNCSIIKCITSAYTKVYNSKTGILECTIPNI